METVDYIIIGYGGGPGGAGSKVGSKVLAQNKTVKSKKT